MKKMLIVLIAAVAIVVSSGSPAAAQSASAGAIVKVPFSFIVGGSVLPAGTYRIAPQNGDWSIITVSSLSDTGHSVSALVASSGASSEPMADARVTFATYRGQHFLQEVLLPGRDSRRLAMSPAQADRVLAKLNLSSAEPAEPAK